MPWKPLRALASLLARLRRMSPAGALGPFEAQAPRVVVGLGNPGDTYVDTRHNVGFALVERLAEELGVAWSLGPAPLRSRLAWATMGGQELLLAMPQTFMNNSGEAVAALVGRTGVPLRQLLVVYDDMDLPLGRLRLREGGSAGTHNGMRSIVKALGDERFPRLRLGIGHAGRGGADARDYVLDAFTDAEGDAVEDMLLRAAAAVRDWAEEGSTVAMNRHNG